MKEQVIKMIQDLAKDTNQTELEATTQLQGMTAKEGREDVLEILCEVKSDMIKELGII